MTDVPPTNGEPPEPPERLAIEPIEIQEEMERSFLDYAMSVIVARALPDARDGLKPVHRRILFGMYDMGARSDRPRLKCAEVSGKVMGEYHPHGDSAIYDSLVRMAQPFSLAPSAHRLPRQLRLPRRQRGRGQVHGMPARRARQRAPRGHRRGHRRLGPDLHEQKAGADGPAGAVPEPARQRQSGHRGRHGHQHPAPQPRRGHRRDDLPDRQSRGEPRGLDEVRAGPGLP